MNLFGILNELPQGEKLALLLPSASMIDSQVSILQPDTTQPKS